MVLAGLDVRKPPTNYFGGCCVAIEVVEDKP